MRSRNHAYATLPVTILLLCSFCSASLRISQQKRDCLRSIEGIKINMMSSCPRESRSFSKNEVFDGTCQTYGPGFQAASPLTPLFILKERLILELRLDELHFYYDLRLKTKMFLNLHGIQGGRKLSTTSIMSPVSK